MDRAGEDVAGALRMDEEHRQPLEEALRLETQEG
jgi:hypothetical protein